MNGDYEGRSLAVLVVDLVASAKLWLSPVAKDGDIVGQFIESKEWQNLNLRLDKRLRSFDEGTLLDKKPMGDGGVLVFSDPFAALQAAFQVQDECDSALFGLQERAAALIGWNPVEEGLYSPLWLSAGVAVACGLGYARKEMDQYGLLSNYEGSVFVTAARLSAKTRAAAVGLSPLFCSETEVLLRRGICYQGKGVAGHGREAPLVFVGRYEIDVKGRADCLAEIGEEIYCAVTHRQFEAIAATYSRAANLATESRFGRALELLVPIRRALFSAGEKEYGSERVARLRWRNAYSSLIRKSIVSGINRTLLDSPGCDR